MADLKQAGKKLLNQMKGTYTVSIGVNEQFSVDKLSWLKRDDRDFFKVTPQITQEANKALKEACARVDATDPAKAIETVLKHTGEAILKHILTRFKGGKRDVKMRPLSPGWIRHKGHNRVGVFSGDLFRDLLNGKVTIRRKK